MVCKGVGSCGGVGDIWGVRGSAVMRYSQWQWSRIVRWGVDLGCVKGPYPGVWGDHMHGEACEAVHGRGVEVVEEGSDEGICRGIVCDSMWDNL